MDAVCNSSIHLVDSMFKISIVTSESRAWGLAESYKRARLWLKLNAAWRFLVLWHVRLTLRVPTLRDSKPLTRFTSSLLQLHFLRRTNFNTTPEADRTGLSTFLLERVP